MVMRVESFVHLLFGIGDGENKRAKKTGRFVADGREMKAVLHEKGGAFITPLSRGVL